jgi:uncharacterized protein (TIGR02996 family)
VTSTLTHDALLAAICEDPTDPLPRLAMMDYWKEQGDELRAEAWKALEDKTPHWDDSYKAGSSGGFCWFRTDSEVEPVPGESELDEEAWLDAMMDDSNSPGAPCSVMVFNTVSRAFVGAVEGYVRWKGETK